MKTCAVCKEEKLLEDFSMHKLRKGGRADRCKACNSRLGKKWYSEKQAKTNRLYSTYVAMKGRCYGRSHMNYPYYGGRGIGICIEWKNSFDTFEEWAQQNGYKPTLQIDRIDNDKGYSPSNCRFVTVAENMRNKRKRDKPLRNYTRVTPADVRKIRELVSQGISQRKIGRIFSVSYSTIGSIARRETWVDIV